MNRTSFQSIKPQLREVWRLSLPAILTQITTITMQYIDSAMVGRLGANASAAIGLVASSTWLMNGVCYALAAAFCASSAWPSICTFPSGSRATQKLHTMRGAIF